MSIIENVFERAGAEEVKVEDLRPGDKFFVWEPYECGIYDGTFVNSGPTGNVTVKDDSGYEQCLYLGEEQRWYLVERAPVEEPNGWGAVVEVGVEKYSRVGIFAEGCWTYDGDAWYDWEDLTSLGTPNVLFEGISE